MHECAHKFISLLFQGIEISLKNERVIRARIVLSMFCDGENFLYGSIDIVEGDSDQEEKGKVKSKSENCKRLF